MMQSGELPIPSAAQVSAGHVDVEGDVGPPRVPLHDQPVVRDGDRQGALVRVVVSLVDRRSGVRGAADHADRG